MCGEAPPNRVLTLFRVFEIDCVVKGLASSQFNHVALPLTWAGWSSSCKAAKHPSKQ